MSANNFGSVQRWDCVFASVCGWLFVVQLNHASLDSDLLLQTLQQHVGLPAALPAPAPTTSSLATDGTDAGYHLPHGGYADSPTGIDEKQMRESAQRGTRMQRQQQQRPRQQQQQPSPPFRQQQRRQQHQQRHGAPQPLGDDRRRDVGGGVAGGRQRARQPPASSRTAFGTLVSALRPSPNGQQRRTSQRDQPTSLSSPASPPRRGAEANEFASPPPQRVTPKEYVHPCATTAPPPKLFVMCRSVVRGCAPRSAPLG